MITQTERKRLFEEAFSLLQRANYLLLAARAKHEQKVAELEADYKKAA